MIKQKEWADLWRFKRSAQVRFRHKLILVMLTAGGMVGIVSFADWWFREEHYNNIVLFVTFSIAFWWTLVRLVFIWINYLRISIPKQKASPQGLTVAIFTTSSPGEPLSMFEKTLEACANIKYPHTTYLLDDTRDPRFKQVAEKYGAVWLELVGIPGAKAGKINAALKLTNEEFILVLDPDHIPFPNLFDHTLGYFDDPKVGFVQISQAYYNQYRSFTALGAAQQTYTFYGPTQMGLYGYGGAVAIGANCTFRRTALLSIGGHGIGLAEDLITSIRLHAAGWKSVYNPVIVSRGLVPEDFGSFAKQQLKWSRGLFEVFFEELPKWFRKLSFWQKISYSTISTYYFVGVTQFIFTLVPLIFFISGVMPASMRFADFLIRGGVIAAFAVAIYLYVQHFLADPQSERGLHINGMVLKYAMWPIYSMGFLLGVLNIDIPYIPTAKKAMLGNFSPLARPLVFQAVAFVLVTLWAFVYRQYFMPESQLWFTTERFYGMLSFALLSFIMTLWAIYAVIVSGRMSEEEPWNRVDLNLINTNEDEKEN